MTDTGPDYKKDMLGNPLYVDCRVVAATRRGNFGSLIAGTVERFEPHSYFGAMIFIRTDSGRLISRSASAVALTVAPRTTPDG